MRVLQIASALLFLGGAAFALLRSCGEEGGDAALRSGGGVVSENEARRRGRGAVSPRERDRRRGPGAGEEVTAPAATSRPTSRPTSQPTTFGPDVLDVRVAGEYSFAEDPAWGRHAGGIPDNVAVRISAVDGRELSGEFKGSGRRRFDPFPDDVTRIRVEATGYHPVEVDVAEAEAEEAGAPWPRTLEVRLEPKAVLVVRTREGRLERANVLVRRLERPDGKSMAILGHDRGRIGPAEEGMRVPVPAGIDLKITVESDEILAGFMYGKVFEETRRLVDGENEIIVDLESFPMREVRLVGVPPGWVAGHWVSVSTDSEDVNRSLFLDDEGVGRFRLGATPDDMRFRIWSPIEKAIGLRLEVAGELAAITLPGVTSFDLRPAIPIAGLRLPDTENEDNTGPSRPRIGLAPAADLRDGGIIERPGQQLDYRLKALPSPDGSTPFYEATLDGRHVEIFAVNENDEGLSLRAASETFGRQGVKGGSERAISYPVRGDEPLRLAWYSRDYRLGEVGDLDALPKDDAGRPVVRAPVHDLRPFRGVLRGRAGREDWRNWVFNLNFDGIERRVSVPRKRDEFVVRARSLEEVLAAEIGVRVRMQELELKTRARRASSGEDVDFVVDLDELATRVQGCEVHFVCRPPWKKGEGVWLERHRVNTAALGFASHRGPRDEAWTIIGGFFPPRAEVLAGAPGTEFRLRVTAADQRLFGWATVKLEDGVDKLDVVIARRRVRFTASPAFAGGRLHATRPFRDGYLEGLVHNVRGQGEAEFMIPASATELVLLRGDEVVWRKAIAPGESPLSVEARP